MASTNRELLLSRLNKNMKLIEIDPFFSPLVPKKQGWNTCVVDRETREELLASYHYVGDDLEKIEPVDVVWLDKPFDECFPQELHGTFDAIIAAHVVEHMIDPIRFFQSASKLLKPGGELLIILPDKRFSFDFFRSVSQTGDMLDPYLSKITNFEPRSAFNHIAYCVKNNGLISWEFMPKNNFEFISNVNAAMSHAIVDAGPNGQREQDFHVWCFVPSSFELIALELLHMNVVDFSVQTVSKAQGGEFFVALKSNETNRLSEKELSERRIKLFFQIFREIQKQFQISKSDLLFHYWGQFQKKAVGFTKVIIRRIKHLLVKYF
jgi:SAM-dependent methyltransferase